MQNDTEQSEAEESQTEATSFENSLKRLEDIVGELEQGNLTLEESLELYEEGVTAYRHCHEKLETAESKVLQLVETLEGELEEEDFDAPEIQE